MERREEEEEAEEATATAFFPSIHVACDVVQAVRLDLGKAGEAWTEKEGRSRVEKLQLWDDGPAKLPTKLRHR